MVIIPIPHATIERLFGSFVADNFNWIMLAILIAGLIIAIPRRSGKDDWLSNAQKRQRKHYEYTDPDGKWTYNEKARMWVDPDQIDSEERHQASERVRQNWQEQTQRAAEKAANMEWVWDEEKQLWVDAKEQRRLARYKEYHKDKPPTFEEWKAQREAEQKQK